MRLRAPGRAGLAALALLPLLTTSVAYQDMTSLLEGGRAAPRWQAFFVPSPAGAIEKATVSFGAKTDGRVPAGAGVSAPGGELYTMDAPRPDVDSPDEARVNRREKTGRVLTVAPFAPPKAFTAGSILERQSLLTPPLSDDSTIQTTFLETDDPRGDLVQVAMNFEPAGGAIPLPTAAPAVMVASLDTKTARLGTGATAVTTAAVSETAALAYGPAEPAANPASTLFGRILRGSTGFVPPIGRNDHSWAATPLPAAAYSSKEQLCLANGIYFEARGESETGQAAVAQVILNRVRNPTYPDTICGVVYQNQNWRNRCQFSFACDGHRKRVTNKRAFSTALRIAGEVTRGETWLPEVGSATHYHATYVRPRWASAMKKVDKIGRHIFYRTYGGGWN
ncbi:cell wall hydrolase [Aureimonas leprariae]|uniref:cell wall hydrolase n=1 Tax=Plantimonas leprariae TaxID=2615207 RepID=UPI001386CB9E|nr:cell wall hydrolase [Aureimonas leprariae]